MPGPVYIAGPTASGKSAVAHLLAQQIGAEIISVDSMQVYRGLDIGTAKPSAGERRAVRHHLIDLLELQEAFDAAQFVRHALAAEADIRGRGLMPIYCGGTGLYFNALLGGLPDVPGPNALLRRELAQAPLNLLLKELEDKDAATFARIDRANPRRVIRAVEVLRTTGQPCSAQRANWKSATQHGLWFGLERERSDLHRRIEERVDGMFAQGLVEETRRLLARGLAENSSAMQAIGYRQVAEYLRGVRDLPGSIALVKQKTRAYAKRQMTWFRHQLQLEWLPVSPEATPASIVAVLRRKIEESAGELKLTN